MPIKVDTEPIALVAVLPVTATSVTLDVTIAVPNDADADKPVSVKGVSDAAPPCITVCTLAIPNSARSTLPVLETGLKPK